MLGQLDEWVEPTGSFEYGDAYAVGTEPPYDYYIYTRDGSDSGYWFNNGPISIVGPAGPKGDTVMGEKGERGSKIYTGTQSSGYFPTGPDILENDIFLSPDGACFQYLNGSWVFRFPLPVQNGQDGVSITKCEIVDGSLIIYYSNGTSQNVGYIQGTPGAPGQAGTSSGIINIIGSVPSVDVLENTYPAEEQEPNAAVLVGDGLGGTDLYVIIDGAWFNSGRFGGGSNVYSEGAFVADFNADIKVDKPTTASSDDRLIGQVASGNAWYPICSASKIQQYVIPIRAANGQLVVPITPTETTHAASKSYVDNTTSQVKNQAASNEWGISSAQVDTVLSGYHRIYFNNYHQNLYTKVKGLVDSGKTIIMPCKFGYSPDTGLDFAGDYIIKDGYFKLGATEWILTDSIDSDSPIVSGTLGGRTAQAYADGSKYINITQMYVSYMDAITTGTISIMVDPL